MSSGAEMVLQGRHSNPAVVGLTAGMTLSLQCWDLQGRRCINAVSGAAAGTALYPCSVGTCCRDGAVSLQCWDLLQQLACGLPAVLLERRDPCRGVRRQRKPDTDLRRNTRGTWVSLCLCLSLSLSLNLSSSLSVSLCFSLSLSLYLSISLFISLFPSFSVPLPFCLPLSPHSSHFSVSLSLSRSLLSFLFLSFSSFVSVSPSLSSPIFLFYTLTKTFKQVFLTTVLL